MEYGICNLAIIPLRKQPGHGTEMVSQLLFGETFEIMEQEAEWLRVITTFDGYEGWLHHLQFARFEQAEYSRILKEPTTHTRSFVTAALKPADNSVLYLPFNSVLPLYDGRHCHINDEAIQIDLKTNLDEDLLATALSFLNVPYLWGGRTHFGIDCSGFSQALMLCKGVHLKRDAWQQTEQGQAVDFFQEAVLGDLAFFDNAEGHIVHVGMMLDNQNIIHASGRVKIEQIDGQGIYSAELKRYTHKLRIVKRYF